MIVARVQILDIPKTLEYLETQGVTVVSFQADDFPAFFTRSSGVPTPRRIDSTSMCEPPVPLSELRCASTYCCPSFHHQSMQAGESAASSHVTWFAGVLTATMLKSSE